MIKRGLLIILIPVALWAADTPFPYKPWTFLVYMAADNNLEPDSIFNQKQMMTVGTNDFINIITYRSNHLPGQEKITRKEVIYNDRIEEVGSIVNADSGDYRTLLDALTWAYQSFPSDHVVVVLWNHGGGPLNRVVFGTPIRPAFMFPLVNCKSHYENRLVCIDDTTGHYLTDLDVMKAFDLASKYRPGKKVDIIGFDACLMSTVEVAYSLVPYANYMVASQETIPDRGWNYADALAPFKKGTMSPTAFAASIVQTYNSFYQPQTNDYTMAATDLSSQELLLKSINDLSSLFQQLLNQDQDGSFYNALSQSSSPNNCTHFEEPTYIDLYHFCGNLISQIPSITVSPNDASKLQSALYRVMYLVNKSVINKAQGSDLPLAHGLSIYFPQDSVDGSYPALYWSRYSNWQTFLNSYLNSNNQ